MRVALVQNQPVFGKKTANIRQLKALIAPVSADLFVLPELAYTGYQFRSFNELRALADGPDSVYIEEMHALARAKQAGIVFGFAEQDGSRIYNAALLITPAGESCLYRKTHLFYREKQLFTPGDTGFHVFPFQGVRLGLLPAGALCPGSGKSYFYRLRQPCGRGIAYRGKPAFYRGQRGTVPKWRLPGARAGNRGTGAGR